MRWRLPWQRVPRIPQTDTEHQQAPRLLDGYASGGNLDPPPEEPPNDAPDPER
jgi:hypothetical protein